MSVFSLKSSVSFWLIMLRLLLRDVSTRLRGSRLGLLKYNDDYDQQLPIEPDSYQKPCLSTHW